MDGMPAKAKLRAKGTMHRALCEQWKARRVELGLTQAEVAKALQITQPAYAQIENGRKCPTSDQIERVSAALKLVASIELAVA